MDSSLVKEQRIRKITNLYYSRPDVKKALFEFSKNREISPRYFEGFGKRPDSFQYENDILELVKKGATSFHCSEELWDNVLNLETGMNEKQLNELRIGWDLVIDIDCKWFDYSKLAAEAIIKTLKNNGVKNIGLKFSGSKGFHIILPWKAFPKQVGGIPTKNLFPELPKKIISYLRYESEKEMRYSLPEDFYRQFKNVQIKKGIRCLNCNEIANSYNFAEFYCKFCQQGEQKKFSNNDKKFFCPECKRELEIKNRQLIFECIKCGITSKNKPQNFSQTIDIDVFDLMGLDLILVSSRHLFRMPYSLHEKTSLASAVIDIKDLKNFQPTDADPLKIKIRNFLPNSEEGEANQLIIKALDWSKENQLQKGEIEEKIKGKYADYKPLKIENLSEKNFPPCIKKILLGMVDGKKRALFTLINTFRYVGMEKEELEKKIYEWNNKNNPPIKTGYIKTQLSWSYQKKPIMPKNCKEFYHGMGVCNPDNLCTKIKNPINYILKKNIFPKKELEKISKNKQKR